MKYRRLKMLVRFVTCLLILLAVAVQRNGSVFGHDMADPGPVENAENTAVKTVEGTTIINTTSLTTDIMGYGGPTPLEIIVKDGRIADIKTLKNDESEAFFNRVRNQVIPQWIGTPVDEVATKTVDAVTGATMSSDAVSTNVRIGIAHLQAADVAPETASDINFGFKYVIILLVVLGAAIIPIFVHDRRYRYVQLALNVLVLGFWSGTFLSYEVFVNYIANGATLWHSLVVLLMLVIAFVYPYFGRSSHYCNWVCPLGSIQELAGRTTRYKIKMSPKLVKRLTIFQECLWLALIFIMCAGIFFEWMNWELFTAFIFEQAAFGVVIAAIVFVLLSVVVNRPYCRFVCPTGCLFQVAQNPEK